VDRGQGDEQRLLRDALQLRAAPDDNAQDTTVEQPLQEQSELDDQSVLYAAKGRGVMLTIDAKALLAPPRPFTDDELTDLIAAVIDDLDTRVIDPSVSTYRSDSGVYVEVSMTIDTDNPWVASATAAAAMRDAFDAAVPAVASMTHGLVLQEA
jgi:hypothetical protein